MLNRFLSRVDELVRIVKRGWGFDDIDVDNPNPTHVVNNVWQRVIAVLQGWDYVNNVRRLVSIDEYGRLVVTQSPAIGITPNIYRYTVSTTPTLVANANLNRSYLKLINLGSNNVFIGVNDSVSSLTGYPLTPNQSVMLDNWGSSLWVVTGFGNSEVSVIER